jgi:5-methyltetrahydropteroyltriglutamate--homocysteine methyltransferase
MTSRAPYRADVVGSLLRPQALKDARAGVTEGRLTAQELETIEDRCIAEAVRRQLQAGLIAVTDGEYRRSWWHFDFLTGLDGVEWDRGTKSIQFHGVTTKAESIAVTGKVGFSDHPMLAHFRYMKSLGQGVPKMTIPSPTVLHFRGGRQAISPTVYPDLEAFYADTAAAYAKAVRAFYDAGCRYLQLDDTVWAYLCSPKERDAAKVRGFDPESLVEIYATMLETVLAAKPADMTITTHVCRGNFRSSWISEGGYEPIAETLLARLPYDGYFLEYDTDRAGGFEPLRSLSKGTKRVVLGLVTSKSGTLEPRADILRRIDEAQRFAPLDQLCLSPQCGFASTEEGNILGEDAQWRKLDHIVSIAREVWGTL